MPTIAWESFTPWSALFGGLVIGLAAAMFVLLNGRIAGISGILGGLLAPLKGDVAWRVAFLAGMILTPVIWVAIGTLPEIKVEASYPVVILAGLLVGIGTSYASGCTSGHGVCGLSRFSLRSLIATLCFMGAGFVIVYLVRHAFSG